MLDGISGLPPGKAATIFKRASGLVSGADRMILANAPAWDVSSPITPTLIGSFGFEDGWLAVLSEALVVWADATFKSAICVDAKVIANEADRRAAILKRERRDWVLCVRWVA